MPRIQSFVLCSAKVNNLSGFYLQGTRSPPLIYLTIPMTASLFVAPLGRLWGQLDYFSVTLSGLFSFWRRYNLWDDGSVREFLPAIQHWDWRSCLFGTQHGFVSLSDFCSVSCAVCLVILSTVPQNARMKSRFMRAMWWIMFGQPEYAFPTRQQTW